MMTRRATEMWRERARGGFCFGGTKGLISYPEEAYQVNADLVGGALQAICESWEAIADLRDNSSQRSSAFTPKKTAPFL